MSIDKKSATPVARDGPLIRVPEPEIAFEPGPDYAMEETDFPIIDAEWADLHTDQLNANRGTMRGGILLDESLERSGAGRSILIDGAEQPNIIAGNKTAEAAMRKGFKLKIVKAKPNEIIAVQREDLDLYDTEDSRARDLATADNRVAEANLDWEFDALQIARDQYGSTALDMWTPDEVEELAVAAAEEDMRLAADAENEQSPLDVGTIRSSERSIVIVECKDANQQANVIDWCDSQGYKWKTP